MLKIIRIIIGTLSAGLATGIGAEIITNPGYSIAILDKIFGITSKVLLLAPLVGTIILSIKERKSKKKSIWL
jgi:hypothetical protein